MGLSEKLSKLSKYGIAITFLSLEVFAFIAFSFGSSYLLFAILSVVLAVLLLVFYFNDIKKHDFASTAFFIFPLLLFSVLVALGIYMKGHRIVNEEFNLAEIIFIPIGLTAVAFCGYALGVDKDFKIRHFLLVIYSSLGVLVAVNLIANLIHFGPFYTIIYKGYYMYFGGLISSRPIQEMAYTLEGFKLIEVDIKHYLLYPILLLSSNFMLFNCSPKKEKRTFITYAAFTILALLALIFVPTVIGALFIGGCLLLDGVIILFTKVKGARKPLIWILRIGIVLFALLVLAIIAVNQDSLKGVTSFISSNSFLSRLLITNRYVARFGKVTQNVIGENFLGLYYYISNKAVVGGEVVAHQSASFVFDVFMFSGFIGALMIYAFLFFGFRSFKKYFIENKDEYRYQTIILSFLVVYFVYSLAFNEGEYGIYYKINKPFFMTGPFMISTFLLVYVFTKGLKENVKKEENENQEVKTNEEQAI